MAQEGRDDATPSLPDRIAACCLSQYTSLPPKGAKPGVRSDGRHEWTILAGVILQVEDDFECISLATGVKALPYVSLSPHGDLLHDSHAEVLARRGARVWLLKRLMSEVTTEGIANDGTALFIRRGRKSMWSLSPSVKLHLYCSTFPCGDASSSVLLRQLGEDSIEEDSRKPVELTVAQQQGTLRGRTNTSRRGLSLRTKPGRLQSLPSISMSCTDKLAMWSIVGFQGSLLSTWICPVFFDSIVIGVESVEEGRVQKAVTDCQSVLKGKVEGASGDAVRLANVYATRMAFPDSRESMQAGLLAKKPAAIVSTSSQETDLVPAAGSLVWVSGEKAESIVEGKRQGSGMPKSKGQPLAPVGRSMLCKRSLFSLAQKASVVLEAKELQPDLTYNQIKHNTGNPSLQYYRRTKERLRGSPSQKEQVDLVGNFLDPAVTAADANLEPRRDASAPFCGWLISGSGFESFTCREGADV